MKSMIKNATDQRSAADDGCALTPSVQPASRVMSTRHFFFWQPASVVLIILTVLYGAFAPLNVWLGSEAAQRGDQQVSHVLYSGAFWNAVVAVLCFTGRRFMARQSRVFFVAGAFALAAALFIVMRTWIVGLLHGRNPFPVIEAVFTWLPMLYAIIYAVRATNSEQQHV
jgi:hypothetical protein